ncbi:MAG: hypothetical protein JXR96_20935 [Deltaproteobacteria bacterium]|nr:hypothetical protein [Deltaproteobacteria bacterium]
MTEKVFDAVKLTRQLRDDLSREMAGMTREERLRYIRDKASSTPLGRALTQEKPAHTKKGVSTDRPPAG